VTYDLVFDEENHIYTVDGEVKPSVSGILEATGISDFSFIPEADREWYFQRGTFVHLAMELLLQDRLNWDTVDSRIIGYVRAGEKFIKDTGFKAICIERPLYHPDFDFCGTPDVTGSFRDGRVVLPDWKSGIVTEPVRYQTAAYAQLCMVNEIACPLERYGIQLKENGKYKMSDCWIDPEDWTNFAGFLRTYKKQKLRIKDGKTERIKK